MNDMPVIPPVGQMPSGPPAPPPAMRPARGRRLTKLAVGVGAAAGVAVGATALAQAATSPGGGAANSDATVTASAATSTTTTAPTGPPGFGGHHRGGFGPLGGFGGGPVLYGQATIKGPNGYETLAERSGTVSDVSNTSGSTWSLTVKSADGTSGTFTVDSGTSVNGGEMGIGSVKTGDTVQVTAVVSGGTSTAKMVLDQTIVKANGGTWRPMGPSSNSDSGSGMPSPQSAAPPV